MELGRDARRWRRAGPAWRRRRRGAAALFVRVPVVGGEAKWARLCWSLVCMLGGGRSFDVIVTALRRVVVEARSED